MCPPGAADRVCPRGLGRLGLTFAVALAAVLSLAALAPASGAQDRDPRPRTIVTTDPELDDQNSMIPFLLMSGDFDVEGLVYASSAFHWKGNGTTKWWQPDR